VASRRGANPGPDRAIDPAFCAPALGNPALRTRRDRRTRHERKWQRHPHHAKNTAHACHHTALRPGRAMPERARLLGPRLGQTDQPGGIDRDHAGLLHGCRRRFAQIRHSRQRTGRIRPAAPVEGDRQHSGHRPGKYAGHGQGSGFAMEKIRAAQFRRQPGRENADPGAYRFHARHRQGRRIAAPRTGQERRRIAALSARLPCRGRHVGRQTPRHRRPDCGLHARPAGPGRRHRRTRQAFAGLAGTERRSHLAEAAGFAVPSTKDGEAGLARACAMQEAG